VDNRPWRFRIAVFAGALVVVWSWTSRFGLLLVNWDNSAYLAYDARSVAKHTSLYLWNNHFGVGHMQHVGAVLARALGGTSLDGFRLVEALFFAGAATILCDALTRILAERRLALAITAAWTFTWVNVFLIMTLEYNTLFLLSGAGVLWLVTQHEADWRPRHSLYAGLLIAVGVLVSWQAAPYLLPASYGALLAGRQRTLVQRLRDAALVPVVFVAAFAAWTLLVAPFSSHSLGELYHVQFSRPQPAFIPSSPRELFRLLTDLSVVTYSFGAALSYMVQHTMYDLTLGRSVPRTLGAIGLVAELALLAWGTRVWWRERKSALHVLALSLFVLTMVTSIYKDITYAYLKRFNFIPLFACFFIAYFVARHPRLPRRALTFAFLAVAVLEIGLAIKWQRHWRADILKDNSPYGREHHSWSTYLRGIRGEHPSACRYVFAWSEVTDAQWLWEVPASLWDELSDKHLVLDMPPDAGGPKLPLESSSSAAFRLSPEARCAWVSPSAAILLGKK
jgi:hypothetical protein